MKNVIVFAVSGARYALELRWVREVIALGYITAVPRGPTAIAGVVNFHGAIVPVLALGELLVAAGLDAPPEPVRAPRPGDGAVLFEVEGARAALGVDTVQTVLTLRDPGPEARGGYVDHHGRSLTLLDPPALLRAALGTAQSAAATLSAAVTEGNG